MSHASSEYSLLTTHFLLYFAKVISFLPFQPHGIWYVTSVPGVRCMQHYTEMFPKKNEYGDGTGAPKTAELRHISLTDLGHKQDWLYNPASKK